MGAVVGAISGGFSPAGSVISENLVSLDIGVAGTIPPLPTRAAIAATVLNLSGANLCGRDWHGVRIPGANLRYGILAHMNLSRVDLTGADLTRTWLYGTDLRGAILDKVEWGEEPRLEDDGLVDAVAYHPR